MTSIEVICARDLDPGLEAQWRDWQAASPSLSSPFFSPAFCRIVAEVREDTRIAVICEDGRAVGLLPYHAQARGRIAPLAGPISDYHGVVSAPGVGFDAGAILGGIGAGAYDFNHAPVAQTALSPGAFHHTRSPVVDLRDGFEAWRLAQRAKVRAIKDVERRGRKMARELGEFRFVPNDVSEVVWDHFMTWKRAALAQMGVDFILDQPWAREVIAQVRAAQSKEFAGMTSALFAGETLAGVHFGMRSATSWHWWFPAFNDDLSRYSPGLSLIMECLKHAEEIGVQELDFGRGSERYKGEFANGGHDLMEGSVERVLTWAGGLRTLRKAMQRPVDRLASPKGADVARRMGNRLLRAGHLRD